MCGIAGIFSYHTNAPLVNRDELVSINDQMFRRGPDGEGVWIKPDKRISLAHKRLSIIDLTNAAHQPMAVNDGQHRITFIGEIYNYQALWREIESSR